MTHNTCVTHTESIHVSVVSDGSHMPTAYTDTRTHVPTCTHGELEGVTLTVHDFWGGHRSRPGPGLSRCADPASATTGQLRLGPPCDPSGCIPRPAPRCLLPKTSTGRRPHLLQRTLWGQGGRGTSVSRPPAGGPLPGSARMRPARSTYRWEREEGDGEHREAGGDGLPDPCLGHLVPVADGGDRDL